MGWADQVKECRGMADALYVRAVAIVCAHEWNLRGMFGIRLTRSATMPETVN